MTGIIILAAGSSSRLGKPKQNLLYQGKTLLQHTLQAAIYSPCEPVIIVLGANRETIEPEIADTGLQIIHNADWAEGMSVSIRLGVAELQKKPHINSVIILLCDQPFVDTELINKLLQTKIESGKGIVACEYNKTLGVPVLFEKQYFDELLTLKGNEGAKKLLTKHSGDIAAISFAEGAIDIDTMNDYDELIRIKTI